MTVQLTKWDVVNDLVAARALAEAGVPIFVARQAIDENGAWDPRGGHQYSGYWFPSDWQQTVADAAVVDTWSPGDALCAVMGHVVDALDTDPRNGGEQTRDGLRSAGMWPLVYGTAATPSGGTHELIAPLRVGSRDGVRPGLDVKGGRPDATGRGFIFVAPTVKLSKSTGKITAYRWTSPPMPEEIEAGDDSGAALAELVREARGGNRDHHGDRAEVQTYDGPPIAELPSEQQARITAWVTAAVTAVERQLRDSAGWDLGRRDSVGPGRGWERLQADCAWRLGQLARAPWNDLNLDQAREVFIDAAPTDANWTRKNVEEKWLAQSRRGTPAPFPRSLTEPHSMQQQVMTLPDGRPLEGKERGTFFSGDSDRADADRAHDDLREGMHHGQLRMAYRLVNSRYRDRLMHVHGVGWHHWDGRRWALDDQGHAVRAVRHVLRRALEATLDLDTEAAKALRRDVDKCSSATGANGVLALAASMAPFAVTVRDLDADVYLLNCVNGTLDLRNLELRGHDPADRITKVTTAAYDPTVDAAEWHKFLDRVLPIAEVREFLQRLAGIALMGRVVEHVLGILTGTGANGKGCFTRALEHALGDYAATGEADLFLQRDGAHPTGEYDLLGRRWVTVSETDEGRRLAPATMKRLTGGDPIKARRMRQDFIEFQASHTAVLVTNHLPAVRGDDPAIWRRIRVVPFDVVIPEVERDKHLDERLQLHADAVLAWAVAGYRDYAARGDLGEPEAVTVATSAYRLDSDALARFIADECIANPHGHVAAGELYSRWQRWRGQDGAEELSAKAFGQALDRKGYPADRQSGRRIRRGLLLTTEGEES